MKLLCVIGTRPEAIKLAPLVLYSKNILNVSVDIYLTGQHTDLITPILDFFELDCKYTAIINRESNTVNELLAQSLQNFSNGEILTFYDGVIVQGDTTSALSGALAAFNCGLPVFHVEAGLRTGDMKSPFPEEMNRVLISKLSILHFCPTERAVQNLSDEGYKNSQVKLTGNTVIDNCYNFKKFFPISKLLPDTINFFQRSEFKNKGYILVTCHRRENQQFSLDDLCDGLREFVSECDDVNIVFVMHANPILKVRVMDKLGEVSNIYLVDPLPYQDFIYFMMKAKVIISDSGGIQEEAPSFNVPVLIFRKETERVEAIEAGGAKLIGTNKKNLIENLRAFFKGNITFKFSENPFGDGSSSQKIITEITKYFKNV